MAVKAAPVATVGAPGRQRARNVLPNYLFILPYFLIFLIFSAGPIIYTIYMSFFNRRLLNPVAPFVGLQNYSDLWTNDPLWYTVLWNTVEFVIITVIGTTLVALAAAMLLHAVRHGQTTLRTIFFAPAVLSVSIMGIIWNWLLAPDFGALNFLLGTIGIHKVPWISDAGVVMPALALATVWWNFGFPMIVFLAGLLNISKDVYEAAGIDGANAWQRFTAITLPLLRPTILFVLVTQIVAHFQVFGQPYIITQGGPGDASRTILMYLYDVVWRHFQYGYGAAIAITLAIIMAVITAINFFVLGRRTEA